MIYTEFSVYLTDIFFLAIPPLFLRMFLNFLKETSWNIFLINIFLRFENETKCIASQQSFIYGKWICPFSNKIFTFLHFYIFTFLHFYTQIKLSNYPVMRHRGNYLKCYFYHWFIWPNLLDLNLLKLSVLNLSYTLHCKLEVLFFFCWTIMFFFFMKMYFNLFWRNLNER